MYMRVDYFLILIQLTATQLFFLHILSPHDERESDLLNRNYLRTECYWQISDTFKWLSVLYFLLVFISFYSFMYSLLDMLFSDVGYLWKQDVGRLVIA